MVGQAGIEPASTDYESGAKPLSYWPIKNCMLLVGEKNCCCAQLTNNN